MLGLIIPYFVLFVFLGAGLVGLLVYLRFAISKRFKSQNLADPKKIRLAFFHPKWYINPYLSLNMSSNAGGGGEKVLWCMVDSLMKTYSSETHEIAIYTGTMHIKIFS
jgi:hypothetical protein